MIQILFFIKLENIILKLNVIPKTIEKYMSFTIQQPEKKGVKPGLPLVFIDSVHVLNNSLDNLVENLGKNDFYHLNQEFNTNVLDLLKKKGFFLYDYRDSFEKFNEGLPNKDKFYNTLTNCAIIDKN